MKVKIKHKKEVDDMQQVYKINLENTCINHICMIVVWFISNRLVLCITGSNTARRSFMPVLLLILFSLVCKAYFIIRKRKDLEIGIALLRKYYLRKIKIEGKFVKFYFREEWNNGKKVEKTLLCFKVKYSNKLGKDEIVVNCRNNTVKVSNCYLISK